MNEFQKMVLKSFALVFLVGFGVLAILVWFASHCEPVENSSLSQLSVAAARHTAAPHAQHDKAKQHAPRTENTFAALAPATDTTNGRRKQPTGLRPFADDGSFLPVASNKDVVHASHAAGRLHAPFYPQQMSGSPESMRPMRSTMAVSVGQHLATGGSNV